MKSSYLYIVRCTDNSLYTGITTDIEKRIKEHYYKKPQCAKYTKSHDVKSLELVIELPSYNEAQRLEYKIKKMTKSEKEEAVLQKNGFGFKILPIILSDIIKE